MQGYIFASIINSQFSEWRTNKQKFPIEKIVELKYWTLIKKKFLQIYNSNL